MIKILNYQFMVIKKETNGRNTDEIKRSIFLKKKFIQDSGLRIQKGFRRAIQLHSDDGNIICTKKKNMKKYLAT